MNLDKGDINFILNLLKESGNIALKYFNSKEYKVDIKEDDTPVTIADKEISKLIISQLSIRFPDIGIISEEGDWFSEDENLFWLVDPIDGTKHFIQGENEFTINIGLIKDGKPIYGFIFVPAVDGQKKGVLYYTDENKKSVKFDLNTNQITDLCVKNADLSLNEILANPVSVISSGESKLCYVANTMSRVKVKELISLSSSLKFCRISEGEMDIYLHCKDTHEWDTAAGHAIVLGAKGRVEDTEGNDLLYGKPRFLNPNFIAY